MEVTIDIAMVGEKRSCKKGTDHCGNVDPTRKPEKLG